MRLEPALGALAAVSLLALGSPSAANTADHAPASVTEEVIVVQRTKLAEMTADAGFGPQSPRDIDSIEGSNEHRFAFAPPYSQMNLCNIHLHKNAEHKGGEFTTFAGNGDGHGYGTGYRFNGELTAKELAPLDVKIGASSHGELLPGDTIEVHFVYSTANVSPGATLGACMNDAVINPQLRVETQVAVLVNDPRALDFVELTEIQKVDGFYQALHLPTDMGKPVQYAGSTTGPDYNEKGSPFQVSWGVRPKVAKVDIASVGRWFANNPFDEDHAHGVRNLVVNPDLLSAIGE